MRSLAGWTVRRWCGPQSLFFLAASGGQTLQTMQAPRDRGAGQARFPHSRIETKPATTSIDPAHGRADSGKNAESRTLEATG